MGWWGCKIFRQWRSEPHGSLRLKNWSQFKVGLNLLAHNPFNSLQGQPWHAAQCNLITMFHGRFCGRSLCRHGMENLPLLLYFLGFCTLYCLNEIKVVGVDFLHVWNRAKTLLYLIFAKHISLGNAEQQGIGNLPSSTSHQNSDRFSLQDTRLFAPENNDTVIVQSTWRRCLFMSGGFTQARVS